MRYIDVNETDDGNSIVLPMDTTLRVVLTEKPSTGYRWQVEDKSSGCLEMVFQEFSAKHSQMIGAPGLAVFYFKPIKPGRCTLILKLWRSWEGDKSTVKWFQITVSIINR